MQKILAAFDKCKDSLAAKELCILAKKTLEEVGQEYLVDMVPLTDGGEGFVEILTLQAGGEFIPLCASDSLGRKKELVVGLCELEKLPRMVKGFLSLPDRGRIVIIEMASVVGLADLKRKERNAWKTSTVGIGEVLKYCSTLELDAILLGIGGSSTNDMGLGALSGLGMEIFSESGDLLTFPSPETWSELAEVSIQKMVSLPPLKIACDVKNSLLGPTGATHQFGAQNGLSSEDIVAVEDEMNKMVQKLGNCFLDAEKNSSDEGSGAAGGIGYGLGLVYDVSMVAGFDLIRTWFNLDQKIKDSEIVITGEGRFDQTSVGGKGPFELIRKADQYHKQAHVFAGSIEDESKFFCEEQFSNVEIHEFGDRQLDLEENFARAEEFFVRKLREILHR